MKIKNRDGKTIFEGKAKSLRDLVEKAVAESAAFNDADLRDADLEGADLQDANLDGAFLGAACLRSANLKYANLEGVILGLADLRDANLEDARLRNAQLRQACLRGANLRGAFLGGAGLGGGTVIDAGQDQRGYRFVAVQQRRAFKIAAGCHWFTLASARKHWAKRHNGKLSLKAECLAKLDLIEAVARARGWIK